jgi:hypothetical protein
MVGIILGKKGLDFSSKLVADILRGENPVGVELLLSQSHKHCKSVKLSHELAVKSLDKR